MKMATTAAVDPKLPFTTTVANSRVGVVVCATPLLRKLTWSDIECARGLV
jgi:hypothetical protein